MKTSKQTDSRTGESRRKFTKAVAAAFVAAPLTATAQRPAATPTETKAPPNPQPAQTQQPSPVAEAYAEVARARFGSQVTDEEMRRIKRDLEGNVRTAERLRTYKLQNSDEPDFIFEA